MLPRKAKARKQCKKAQRQHKIALRRKHPTLHSDISAKQNFPKMERNLTDRQFKVKANSASIPTTWDCKYKKLIAFGLIRHLDIKNERNTTDDLTSNPWLQERSKLMGQIQI